MKNINNIRLFHKTKLSIKFRHVFPCLYFQNNANQEI